MKNISTTLVKATRSSVNPDNLSLTIKGILTGLIPLAIFLFDLPENVLIELVDAITKAVAIAMVLYGLIRKVIVAYKK